MTKKEARARQAAWRAIAEGRIIRYTHRPDATGYEHVTMCMYPTKEAADKALAVQLGRIAAGESIHSAAQIVVRPT